MIRFKCPRILFAVLVLVSFIASGNAEVPNTINYQGRLTDDGGQPITGSKLIKFKIYGSPAGDDSLWTSSYRIVQVDDGLFTYELGSNVPLPADLFSGSDSRYLGITVDVDAEIDPRTQIISVPYARHARVADSVSGTGYVRKTGDTISGHMYFDNDGLGKEAELLLYTDQSIMNFYESGAKRISLESEFGTVVLRGQDGDLSVWLSGGEDVEEGGSIRLYNSEGTPQIYLDGDYTGDASAVFTSNAINAEEMLNEPGIAYNTLTGAAEISTSSMADLITVSIAIPAPGYIHLTGKAVIQRSVPSPPEACYCGVYMQVDSTSGGSWTLPHFSYIASWVETTDEGTLNVQRTYYIANAGTYTFRMEASRYATGEGCVIWAYNREITAVYYPTSYNASK